MKHNNKGFTLVEVLVCIALLSIVITPIGFMMINQSKSTRDNHYKTLVQQNVQTAMAAFRTKCIPASSVTTITDAGGISAMSESTANMEFSKLVIKNKYTNELTTYEYDSSSKTLSYNGSAIVQDVSVYLTPLPDTSTYTDCKGLKVHIISDITDAGTSNTYNVDLENQFYFRNS